MMVLERRKADRNIKKRKRRNQQETLKKLMKMLALTKISLTYLEEIWLAP